MSFKTFCSCDRRDVLTYCTISLRIPRLHTQILCCGSSILAGRVSYTLLFDAARKEAVLYGQIRQAGALSAPETPDGIRNLKTILPATRGFQTDGHHVQLCTEHMFTQHRFPCNFSEQCSHADSFLPSQTSYPLVRLILPYQTISSELRQNDGT